MKRVRLVGVPMDLGGGRRGVDMGPSAIRIARLGERLGVLGCAVVDDGDVGVPAPEARDPGDPRARYLQPIYHVCNRLRMRIARALDEGDLPVVLGGDHSIAIGSVSGVAEHVRARGERFGLIWVDAHADMNTPETSPSGNVHGMPLATLLGKGAELLVNVGGFAPKVEPERTCLIGIRNLDAQEKEIVRASGVQAFTMRDVDERGMRSVAAEAIARAGEGTVGFHVSFDLDALDPAHAPGVGTPVKGGLSWREANLLMEMVADSGQLLALEITELNPVLDVRNQSAETAVDLILSALGKSIL